MQSGPLTFLIVAALIIVAALVIGRLMRRTIRSPLDEADRPTGWWYAAPGKRSDDGDPGPPDGFGGGGDG